MAVRLARVFNAHYTSREVLEPMALHPHLRSYFWSVTYAFGLLFMPLLGPRFFGATLLHIVICASLLVLLILFLAHRNRVVKFISQVFRACGSLLLCLLEAFPAEWIADDGAAVAVDPFRAVLFQRPPPVFA
jgi:O-antigen/teichoic acid export membrane protein